MHKKNVFLTDYLGNNYYLKTSAILSEKYNLDSTNIKNNISNIERVYDAIIYKDEIFITYVKKIKNCGKIFVSKAKISTLNLEYKNIFVSKSCHDNASPGRMVIHELEKKKRNFVIYIIWCIQCSFHGSTKQTKNLWKSYLY